jgi:DNA-binding MarR family transcriptional regulator
MQRRGLPLYRRWRLWHDDMTLQLKSLHSLDQLLKVPELRTRAILGPSIEASCIALTFDRVTNARSLSRLLGVTYAATHAAVERLVGRGLLVRTRNGVRQDLRLSNLSAAAFTAS